MLSTACSEGRHQGTRTPDRPVVPTLDQDNRGRIIGDWSQPACTGRLTALQGISRCACPCHQPGTTTT